MKHSRDFCEYPFRGHPAINGAIVAVICIMLGIALGIMLAMGIVK